jgi:hypothetical protein
MSKYYSCRCYIIPRGVCASPEPGTGPHKCCGNAAGAPALMGCCTTEPCSHAKRGPVCQQQFVCSSAGKSDSYAASQPKPIPYPSPHAPCACHVGSAACRWATHEVAQLMLSQTKSTRLRNMSLLPLCMYPYTKYIKFFK